MRLPTRSVGRAQDGGPGLRGSGKASPHSPPQSLQGLTGTPLVAGSPIRHDSAVQGSAVEVQTFQPPWKALSEFALQSDLDQPAFQQLVRARVGIRSQPGRRGWAGRACRRGGAGRPGPTCGKRPPGTGPRFCVPGRASSPPSASLTAQVSFSESGSLGNSSGSDVTSLSSQLPDTPNSMVPSPVET